LSFEDQHLFPATLILTSKRPVLRNKSAKGLAQSKALARGSGAVIQFRLTETCDSQLTAGIPSTVSPQTIRGAKRALALARVSR
jgi:hypothetical protein